MLSLSIYLFLTWLFAKRIRDDLDRPYLTRYHLLWSPWFKVYLHHIHREDHDRHPHNHPWSWCKSLILCGGYVEHRPQIVAYVPYDWNHIDVNSYHVITWVKRNTWTLFLAGRKVKSWGFLVDGKHVDKEIYFQQDGQP